MMRLIQNLFFLAAGICFVSGCFGDETRSKITIFYQMIEIKSDQQRPWIVGDLAHYHGVYTMEEGSGDGAIYLWVYLDDGKSDFRFSGYVATSEDILAKPDVMIFNSLKFFPSKGSIANGKITITPMKIKPDPSKKWMEGVVYNGIFFRKRSFQ